MLNNVQSVNKVILQFPEQQNITDRIRLPDLNALVDVKILEKVFGNYKVLINGSLFQTKLPLQLNNGETILAKVVSHKPFTLEISNPAGKNLSFENINQIIQKLDLENTTLIKDVIKTLAEAKKPLVKSKIENYTDLISFYDNRKDEILFNFFMHIIWNEQADITESLKQYKESIFDISFEELVNRIVNRLNDSGQIVRENLLCDKFFMKLFENNRKLFFAEDKINEAAEILFQNVQRDILYKTEWNSLQYLLLKFVLQMSLYKNFGFLPDFRLFSNNTEIYCLIFYYFRQPELPEVYQVYFKIFGEKTGELNFAGYFEHTNFSAIIKNPLDNKDLMEQIINRIKGFSEINFSIIQNPAIQEKGFLTEGFINNFKINRRV